MDIEGLRGFIVNLYEGFIPLKAIAPENGGAGEWARARYLLNIVKGLFDEVKVIEAPDPRVPEGSRPNIVALIKGSDTSRTLWLIAHMDTVPEGDRSLWSYEPFKATVVEDLIYGRGVEDDGHGIAMGITVAKALRDHGIKPPINYGLILASDEETGSNYGIKYVLDHEPGLIKANDLVIVPDAGSPDGSMIEVAEKGILWVKLVVKGRQAHASAPARGLNAHRLGMMLALEVDRRLHEVFSDRDPLFTTPESTFEPTKVEKNVDNINTIPGLHTVYFDCRILPKYSIDDVIALIKNTAEEFCKSHGCSASVEVVSREDPAPPTPPDSEVVVRLSEAIKAVKGVKPVTMGIGGGTYARYLRARGIPAAVWMTASDTAHEPNEYVKISDVLSDVKVILHLIENLGEQPH